MREIAKATGLPMNKMQIHIVKPKARDAGCFICQRMAYHWVRVDGDMKNACHECVGANNLKHLIRALIE